MGDLNDIVKPPAHNDLRTKEDMKKMIEEFNKIKPRFPSLDVKTTPDHIPDNSAGSYYAKRGKLNVLYFKGDDTWKKTPTEALRIILSRKEGTFYIAGNNKNLSENQKKWLEDQTSTLRDICFDFQRSQSKKTETKDKTIASRASNSSSPKKTEEKTPSWR